MKTPKFLESFLLNLFEDELIGNLEYKDTINSLKSTAKTEGEIKIIELLNKLIDNKREECFKDTQFIFLKESDELDTFLYAICSICYYASLIYLHKKGKLKLNELTIKNYIIPVANLKTKLEKSEEFESFRWIPPFLEGIIYEKYVFQHSIGKYLESIQTATRFSYKEQPLAGVYNAIAILYYEEGYFQESIHYFEMANEIWPESKLILNNKAFIYYIIDDSRAFEALKLCYEKTHENNEMAGYNLASYILSKSKKDINQDVIKMLSESYEMFINEYKRKESSKSLLEAFSCVVLENIAHNSLASLTSKKRIPNLKELEKIASRNLLLNLFGDIENFISTTYDINKELKNFLIDEKTITNENIFLVLKRWSSYTPLIPRSASSFKGGGHFFTWQSKGIVIDPGPSFLESFLECGYRLADIDAIICSHGHIDHTQDIERIITLLYEKNEISVIKQKIKLILSPGNASKYGSLLSASTDVLESTIVLYPNKKIYVSDLQIEIEPILANHYEIFARADTALCFAINLFEDNSKKYTIGFTNDTGLNGESNKNVKEFFKQLSMDLFVANIGSISFARLQYLADISMSPEWFGSLELNMDVEKVFSEDILLESLGYKSYADLNNSFFKNTKVEKYDWYRTHLGFRGVLHLAVETNYKYMIISEFGEELKNYRHLIAKSLNQTLKQKTKIFTGDIGTKFLLENGIVKPFCQVQNIFTDGEMAERLVKNEDFRVIHFEKSILDIPFYQEKISEMFGITI